MTQSTDERADRLRLLSRDELAERFNVSKRTISRMLSAGELPRPVRFGRLVRWREIDIAQLLERLIDQKPQHSYNRDSVLRAPTSTIRKR